jgi:hypothetical protein
MRRGRRTWSGVLLVAAATTLTVGVVRAVDVGPGTGALTAATKSEHGEHAAGGGGGAARAPDRRPEHERHAGGSRTSRAALDDGRYALRLDQRVVRVGADRFTFAVNDARSGRPLERFEVEQEKLVHLIVVREDLEGFQHVHPTLGEDGRWTVTEAVLDRAGPWRMIADFVPEGGRQTVLSSTVHASGGRYRARPPRQSERVGDHRWRTTAGRYAVELEARDYGAGRPGRLLFTVRRDGRPAQGLEPYLGALGHAVVLRWGDLAYTHVHPTELSERPAGIDFELTYPAGAPLGAFLQFRHDGRVHTAAFRLPEPRPATG